MINVWLFVSGNYFITKVSYVEGRGEQRSVEHDVLMLVRRKALKSMCTVLVYCDIYIVLVKLLMHAYGANLYTIV